MMEKRVIEEILMPQMGDEVKRVIISRWNKAPGERVELDETLLEVTTDKVEIEVPSELAGRVVEVFYPEGEEVAVGTPIARIEKRDEIN